MFKKMFTRLSPLDLAKENLIQAKIYLLNAYTRKEHAEADVAAYEATVARLEKYVQDHQPTGIK